MDENELLVAEDAAEAVQAAAEEPDAAEAPAAQTRNKGGASEHRLELDGMSCESCERLITRAAEASGAEVREVDSKAGYAVFECDDSALAKLKATLAEKGFSEKGSAQAIGRGDFGRLFSYFSAVLEGRQDVQAEATLLNYSIATGAGIVVLFGAAYALSLMNRPDAAAYAPLLLLIAGTTVLASYSYHLLECFRKEMSCQNGMMAGMTIGMIAGFLVGALVGATNGMFVGSMLGMAAGMGLGIAVGRWCGIMGALEGAMAGLMAGTMGAMLSVMMVSDNLLAFLFVLFASCAAITAGLTYMMHREAGGVGKVQTASFAQFALCALVLALFMALMMLNGPKAGITYP